MDRSSEARDFAIAAHGEQRYGDKPYRAHLEHAVATLRRFLILDDELLCAGWLHDTLEDTAATEDELRRRFGGRVAAIVRAVTLDKGPREAALAKAYAAIAATPGAAVVKLADRIANVEASLENGNAEKLAKYRREHDGFRQAVSGQKDGAKLLAYLDKIIVLEGPPFLARARFDCAACGVRAATLTLRGPGLSASMTSGDASLSFEGFMSNGECAVSAVDELQAALEARDLPGLRRLLGDPTYFWCVDCGACYCAEHWKPHEVHWDDGFYDYTQGTCPKGHAHSIDD